VKLEEKYDFVESYETTDGRIICVRKDGVWEFSDVQGKRRWHIQKELAVW